MTPDGIVNQAAAALGSLAQADVPLGPLTTYRVGGAAALFVEAETMDDLRRCATAVRATGITPLLVGNGSNMLVADGGFAGLAIRLTGDFASIRVDGTTVIAGGAALLPVVARQSVKAGLTGFVWAVGVPGSIGGAVRMNAGGHGSDMAASLGSIRVLDLSTGEDAVVPTAALNLSYRSSSVRAHDVVCEATLSLEIDEAANGPAELRDIVSWRRANQPGGANAGSVFTNPPNDSAGRLIEAAGCKGLRHGTAAVSDKHANFIQADDSGSADDIATLMVAVRALVREHAGVELHAETRLVGFADAVIAELS